MKINRKILSVLFIFVTSYSLAQVQVDKFSGDASYGLPLITVPNFRGPSISTSLVYRSDIKVDQSASEVGLGWDINAGGSIERSVRGVPDDWNGVNTVDLNSADFQKHYGALNLDKVPTSGTSGDVLDFDYTRYKMDTVNDSIRFHYINYDNYYVVGGGMSGEISPENYDYAQVKTGNSNVMRTYNYEYDLNGNNVTGSIDLNIREIDTYTIDLNHQFNYKTHFRYNHNNYAEVDSRYFPWNESPISSTTDLYTPGELVNGSTQTYEGDGYNDEFHSDPVNKNRSRTANYVQYYTNDELKTGVTGFLEYKSGTDRSNTNNFPADGIGAYQIVGPDGYTYHYSLPVYSHYTISGNFYLDKDHAVVIAEGGEVGKNEDANGSYLLENDETFEVLESKQNVKYAIRWLLTAITGPDFEDSNSNGRTDLADKGYWVKYDYGLWTETFADRFPYYGASYAFSKSIEEGMSAFMNINDENRNSGKLLAYSETADQKYYLNQIQTPSHTGIFVRDLRNDEQSTVPLKTTDLPSTTYSEPTNNGSGQLNTQTIITDHLGAGRLTSTHPEEEPFSHILNIKPPDYGVTYNDINLTFATNTFIHGEVDYDIRVFDGEDGTGNELLHRYPGDGNANSNVVHAHSGAISIVTDVTPYGSTGLNYDISWDVSWGQGLIGPKKKPQLKLAQLLLLDNDDLSSLPALTAINQIPDDQIWEYDELNLSSFYNSDWYTANKTAIDAIALQSVVLEQDYSLSKQYNNNRFVTIGSDLKTNNQIEVEASKTVATNNVANSGKLTLNKVIYYGLNKTQTQPAHLFDYNTSSAADNPNYNNLKQDYWGNYKSDASGNLLRGYVTAASSSKTDAWSLRKITSPLGGVTEIVYESDEYEQVISESLQGGLRGPIKTFALENATSSLTNNSHVDWTFEVENEEIEFWNLANNLPLGAIHQAVIPGVWINSNNPEAQQYYENSYDYFLELGTAVSYGDATLSYDLLNSTSSATGLSYYEPNLNLTSPSVGTWGNELAYAGEGYVAFNYPIGEKIYGGGTRVKELKVSNDAEIYTVAYEYEQGTATVEASDYSIGKIKKDDIDNYYNWGLTSFEISPFGLNPQVGYGQVTIENKGRVTEGQGKSVFTFHVSSQSKNYYQPYIQKKYITEQRTEGATTYTDEKTTFAVEVIDDFTTIWGKIKEQNLEDINGNQISKKVYQYATSSKGAHVSTINFETNKTGGGSQTLIEAYNLSIMRKYPNYLNNVITYSNGRKSESMIVDRDPFTGVPTETQSTSINGTENKEEIILAYSQTTPAYQTMGPKSDNHTNDNFLNATYASKTYRTVDGVTTNDFSSYSKSFWKETAPTFYFDANTSTYKETTTNVNWYDYTQYTWAGELGNYGLFSNTTLTDVSAKPASSSKWRFLSEITLMDEEQNVLEQKGYNDRYAASKLGYGNRFTYTSGSNSNYVSFTATGFETSTEVTPELNYTEGEVELLSGSTLIQSDGAIVPHTGNYLVKIASTKTIGPTYTVKSNGSATSIQTGRTYSASAWVHKNSPNDAKIVIDLVGSSSNSFTNTVSMRKDDPNAIQIGDWIQLNVDIFIPVDFVASGASEGVKVSLQKTSASAAWFDDLQFKSRVTGSGMNVYDQKTGRVMATLSDNNFATKYVYNNAGQVIEVWQEILGDVWGEWVKVQSSDFNFKRDME